MIIILIFFVSFLSYFSLRSFVAILKISTTIITINFQKGLPLSNEVTAQMEKQGEIPMIVIVSVSVCGTILLLLNIVLISCFVHKKRQQKLLKDKENGSSDGSGSNTQKQTPPSEGRFKLDYFLYKW